MNGYALKIVVGGETFRLSTDKFIHYENGINIAYQPVMTDVSESTSEISIDGSPPIPRYNVDIWDGAREVIDSFNKMDYESAECELLKVEDGKVVGSFRGYMTDVSYDGGLSFSIRADENYGYRDLAEEFTVNTFQYSQTMVPYEATAVLNLEPMESMWDVATEQAVLSAYLGSFPTGFEGDLEWGYFGGQWYERHVGENTYMSETEVFNITSGLGIGHVYGGRLWMDTGIIYNDGGGSSNVFFHEGYRDYVVTNVTKGASARLSGYVQFDSYPGAWTIDTNTNEVIRVGGNVILASHDPLIKDDGGVVSWDAGDVYTIHKVTDEDAQDPLPIIVKKSTRLRSYNTSYGGNLVTGITLNIRDNVRRVLGLEGIHHNPEWRDERLFDGGFRGTDDGTYVTADDLAGWCIIGGPQDEIQIVARYSVMRKVDDRIMLEFVSLDYPNIPGAGDIDISDPRVKRLLDSVPGPEIRPLYVGTPEHGTYVPTDTLYIKHNNFLPFDRSTEEYKGFISLGNTYSRTVPTPEGDVDLDINEVYRFVADIPYGIDTDQELANLFELGFLKLDIHSQRYIPSDNPYNKFGNVPAHKDVVELDGVNFSLPWASEVDVAKGVKLYDEQWLAASMSFKIDSANANIDIPESGAVDETDGYYKIRELHNRLRGVRIDMLNPLADIVQAGIEDDSFGDGSGDHYEAVMSQASEHFAICTSSEVLVRVDTGDVVEVVNFSLPEHAGDPQRMLADTDSDIPNFKTGESESRFINRMIAPSMIGTLRWWREDDTYANNAGMYFSSKTYRAIRNPVPENSDSLGKRFPIAYGLLRKVPLLHVMGTKAYDEGDLTAGDDVYIYSTNRCQVLDESAIELHLGEKITDSHREEIEMYNIHAIESPFPKFSFQEHWVIPSRSGQYGRATTYPHPIGPLAHPYHRLVTLETSGGSTVYGIKLRGHEWNPALGRLDRRYPIRHGIGSTPLLGSFTGAVDSEGRFVGVGEPIIHPLDVIRHFVTMNSHGAAFITRINDESVERVKSKTRKYEAAVYITEDIDSSELINKICEQFGFWHYEHNGEIHFALAEIGRPNLLKPIRYDLNIGNNVEEVSDGYKDIYNKLTYRYRKDWVDEKWEGNIRLTDDNSYYCRMASKAKGQLKEKIIEAEFVNSDSVARDVVTRLEKILCSRKITYKFDLRYVEGIDIVPGEFVPMTYPPFDIYNESVLIRSVKHGLLNMEVEVIRFPELALSQAGESSYRPSRKNTCD